MLLLKGRLVLVLFVVLVNNNEIFCLGKKWSACKRETFVQWQKEGWHGKGKREIA
jgi:hypothetical protein